jgi:hypothetical protein
VVTDTECSLPQVRNRLFHHTAFLGHASATLRWRAKGVCCFVQASMNQPTWAGQHGAAGAPPRHRAPGPGGPSGAAAGAGTGQAGIAAGASGAGGSEAGVVAAAAPRRFGQVAAPRVGGVGAPLAPAGAPRAGSAAGGAAAGGSSALLEQVRARQRASEADAAAGTNRPGSGNGGLADDVQGMDAQLLAAEVVLYLHARGCEAREESSTQLVAAFRRRVADERMPVQTAAQLGACPGWSKAQTAGC